MNKIYTPIEYLESTGTQFIDSGILATNTTGFKCKFSLSHVNNQNAIVIGVCSNTTNGRQAINTSYPTTTNYSLVLSWNTLENKNMAYPVYNDVVEASLNFNNSRLKVVNGNTLALITEAFDSGAGSFNIGLFGAYWRTATPTLYHAGKIFSVQITDGETLVRDFIPVLDQDGTPCMYDRATNEFFYNQGTGQFIAGPIIKHDSNIKSYKRIARDKLLVDTNVTNEVGSLTEEIDSPYQTYGGLQEDNTFVYPAAYLKNRIAGSDGVFQNGDYSTNFGFAFSENSLDASDVTKVDFYVQFTDSTPYNGAEIFVIYNTETNYYMRLSYGNVTDTNIKLGNNTRNIVVRIHSDLTSDSQIQLTGQPIVTYSQNKYHHVVLSWDPEDCYFEFDGVRTDMSLITATASPIQGQYLFGIKFKGGYKNFKFYKSDGSLKYHFPLIHNENGNKIKCSITGIEGTYSKINRSATSYTYSPYNNLAIQKPLPDLKIVENNCLTLDSQYVFFYENDISSNVSKLDFWVRFNATPTNNTAIFTFIPKDGTNKGMYFWANSLTGMGVRIYDENGYNINANTAGGFSPKNLTTNVWYNIKLDINANSISFNDVAYTISSGTSSTTTHEKTPAYIGYNPYEGARPKFSICELKMYDSNDNLLHYFPMSEGDGDIIYDAVKDNHIAGRVHYNGTETTSGSYRGELKRDWVKALWANKQDMFAYNAINGWYEVNNQCSEKYGDIASRNIKLPNNVICSLKTDSGSNGSLFWDYGTTANNIRDYYDGYKLNLTKYQITPVLYGTLGRYSFPCIWLQNKYLNDKSDNIRFKCHYNLDCPDNLTWNFYVYPPNKAISSLSIGEGDILIEGNTSLNSHADSSSMGCYTKLYNTTQTTPSSGSTFEMTNIEIMHYDTYILSYRKPVQYGLNGCESKLQLPDGTIYDPKNTRTTQVPTVYQTGQGIYAQQNFLNYTEELSGVELVRVNNKLMHLPDGRTVPQKADVNIIYPEMYATFGTTDTYLNGRILNWGKLYNNAIFKDSNTYMYTYTGETFTIEKDFIRIPFGASLTISNGNYYKFTADKIQFQLEDIWLQEGTDTSTKLSLSGWTELHVPYRRFSDNTSFTWAQFSQSSGTLTLPFNKVLNTKLDDTMQYLFGTWLVFYLPEGYTVTQNQTRLYVKGLKIDAYGFTPIDMRGHNWNSTTGVETVNDTWNQEYIIQYPGDKYYKKPELPISGGVILS